MSRITRIAPNTSYAPTEASRYQALKAQIAYLRSPTRRDGPSRWEAEEVALSLENEADTLCEALFYSGADRAAKTFPL